MSRQRSARRYRRRAARRRPSRGRTAPHPCSGPRMVRRSARRGRRSAGRHARADDAEPADVLLDRRDVAVSARLFAREDRVGGLHRRVEPEVASPERERPRIAGGNASEGRLVGRRAGARINLRKLGVRLRREEAEEAPVAGAGQLRALTLEVAGEIANRRQLHRRRDRPSRGPCRR